MYCGCAAPEEGLDAYYEEATMMNYSLQDLFNFMESGNVVKATCVDGQILQGRCWAYSSVQNMEEDGINEPSLEIGNTMLYLSEIEHIEYVD